MKLILTFVLLITFLGSPLHSDAQTCAIDAVVADISPCDNGQFFAVVNFAFENTSNEGFSLTGNGNEYGSFLYSQLPVKIGPLPGDGITEYEFVVTDLVNSECSDFVVAGIVDCPPPCAVEGLVVDPGECTSTSTYAAVINFEAVGFTQFDLFVNGEFHSFHAVNELPLELTNIPAGGSGVDLIKICANDNPECCKVVEVLAPDCAGPCEIANVVATPLPCDGSQFWVELTFEFANNPSEFFTVHGNGKNYGEFPYSQLPITLGPFPGDGQTPLEFVVKDAVNPECQAFTALDVITCGCAITELVVDPGTCTSDGTYSAFVNFSAHGFELFDLYLDGSLFGTYQVAQLPLELNNLPYNGANFAVIKICANDIPECCQSREYPVPDCQPNCELGPLQITRSECDGQLFNVKLDFEHAGNTSETFQVAGNGHVYGTYPYAELPITIGPFEGDGQIPYEFVVTDSEHPDCQTAGELGPVFCGCEIGELIVETGECLVTGSYQVGLNFESVGFSSFNVFSNGQLVGSWNVDDLPIVIEHFPASGHPTDALKVCARNVDACCRSTTVTAPDCAVLACEILELHAAPLPCEGEDFFVEINFETKGQHSETFKVVGNGQLYGTFPYSELPVIIGPLKGNGTTTYEFIVSDTERDGCSAETVIDPVFCGCEVGLIEYNSGDCTSESTYEVTIDFEAFGFESFDVYVNDHFHKHALVSELPLTLEQLPASGKPFDILKVCANDRPDCCSTIEIAAPDCVIDHCEIYDLTTHRTECDAANFYVEIDFEHSGPNSGHFQVTGNGVNYGTFAYADLPIKVGPLPGDGKAYEFAVFDLQYEDCGAFTVIDGVWCGCEIGELKVETGECTSESTYIVYLDFESHGVQSFDVFANGQFLKHASINELPLELEAFHAGGNPFDLLEVCANDNDQCCATAEIPAPDCILVPCEILDLEAAATECDSEGHYYVKLNFDPAGSHSEYFIVEGNNQVFERKYADLPVEIGPFNGNGDLENRFVVYDAHRDACHAVVELGPVFCGCHIGEVRIETGECSSDEGTYAVSINFESKGFEVFELYVNGHLFEKYEVSQLPLQIPNFPASGRKIDEIKICGIGTDCCVTKEVEAPDCAVIPCEIGPIHAEVSDCDEEGHFYVILDFEHEGTGEKFGVFGNGNKYGEFKYEELPVKIGPLVGNGELFYEIGVSDLQHDGCHAAVEIGRVICPVFCQPHEIVAQAGECLSSRTYLLHIDNIVSPFSAYDIYINHEYMGFYTHENLPIQMEVETSGSGFDLVTVCVSDNETCCISIEVVSPDCTIHDCKLTDLVLETDACENDSVFVKMDFQYDHQSDQGFSVSANGVHIGDFHYEDLPVSLGRFAADGQTGYILEIFDLVNDQCTLRGELDPISCPTNVPENEKILIVQSSNQQVTLRIPDLIKERTRFEVFSVHGHTVFNLDFSSKSDQVLLQLPYLHEGIYFVKMRSKLGGHSTRFLIR